MNFEVLLIGRQLKNSKNLNRTYKTFRFKLLFNKGFLFYAEYNFRLFFKLLFLKKDILLANDLDSLLSNYFISKISKTKLVYDSHELFTELPELINRPFTKEIWSLIEGFILPKIRNCYTVCESIANYYNTKYSTNFQVIRNYPEQSKLIQPNKFPFDIENEKIILYQGALNKGRGLELMIDTMQYIDNAIFVIIGDGDLTHELKEKVISTNTSNRVKFVKKKFPEELQKLTILADLGISIEEDLGLNYRFALPNKLFDYIQARIPVLVSNLPEMSQMVLKHNVGEIITDRNSKDMAMQINALLRKGKNYYSKALEKASKELTWQNESKKIIHIFKNID